MMNRRVVHLVANHVIHGRLSHTLHLIDPSTFFHSTKPGSGDDGTRMEEFRPPPPVMTFYGPCTEAQDMDFMAIGRGSEKGILAVDCKGSAVLYSASSQALTTIPTLHARKVDPISLSVGDRLYVMNEKPRPRDRRHCFETLIRGTASSEWFQMAWHWQSLPPPPYVRAPNSLDDDYYGDSDCDDNDEDGHVKVEGERGDIAGHTVVGDSQIWISTAGAGTYTFDTGSRTWCRHLDWALPFRGRAEYVPEHKLWFGFSSQTNLLCASDLTATSETRPPVLSGEWEDVAQPREWKPVTSYLLPLGSCKFLVAKFFQTRTNRYFINGFWDYAEFDGSWDYGEFNNFAVLAGVELLETDDGGLRMVKHRSKRYTQATVLPDWVI